MCFLQHVFCDILTKLRLCRLFLIALLSASPERTNHWMKMCVTASPEQNVRFLTAVPLLKWSRLDNDVLLGNIGTWLGKSQEVVLWTPESLCCSGRWVGFSGNGGGVCLSLIASNDADEYGLSKWKTLVAEWRGDEEAAGKTTEEHGALKGGWVDPLWVKNGGLELNREMQEEDESLQRGEGTMSWAASSEDFCSRETSEFEQLSRLWKKIKPLNLTMNSSRVVSEAAQVVLTYRCLHFLCHTETEGDNRGDDRTDWKDTRRPNLGCEDSLLLSSLWRTRWTEILSELFQSWDPDRKVQLYQDKTLIFV